MKNSKWILALFFLLSLQIYASPENDTMEFTATLCHFSDTGLKCSCPEEEKEARKEQERAARKVQRFTVPCQKSSLCLLSVDRKH